MNREILFKAKRKDNGEWVEGSLVSTECNSGFIFRSKTKAYAPKGTNIFCSTECYEIDSVTLCQYTELNDKNGRKIWENDIVNTFEEPSKEFLRNVIKFEDGCFKVFAEHYLSMYLDNYIKSDFEVIGNIFDNPELLEVE